MPTPRCRDNLMGNHFTHAQPCCLSPRRGQAINSLAKGSTFLKNWGTLSVHLFGVLHCLQHCTGHITTGSWKGRGNQYIEFVRVLYCKLPTNSKQLPAFPLEAVPGTEPRPQRWEVRVLPLCHRGPALSVQIMKFQFIQCTHKYTGL